MAPTHPTGYHERPSVTPSTATSAATTASAGARCRVHTIGQLRIVDDAAITFSRPAQRRILSILLLHAGERVTFDRLIGRCWPCSPPRTARATIQTQVSSMRQLLPPGLLTTDGDGYRIDTTGVWHDVTAFESACAAAVRQARAGAWHAALRSSNRAASHWTGEPWIELLDDDFAQPAVARLRELRVAAIEVHAESLLALDRALEAVPDLEWATREFPLRERLSSLLAQARQQTGSHAEALRSLHQLERALADAGLEPSPALRILEQQILHHDGVETPPYVSPERRRSA